jgi:hypothetical protein
MEDKQEPRGIRKNGTGRTVTGIVLGMLMVAIAAAVLFNHIGVLHTRQLHHSAADGWTAMRFDSKIWARSKARSGVGIPAHDICRARMVDDLTEHLLLPGMRRAEVEKLIGASDSGGDSGPGSVELYRLLTRPNSDDRAQARSRWGTDDPHMMVVYTRADVLKDAVVMVKLR